MLKRLLLLVTLLASQPLLANPVDFHFTDLEGKSVKLSEYRGKWIVLNYWATWCPPCLAEIPELVLFHENHKDSDAVVVGIDMEELPPEMLQRFVEDNFMTYPIVPMSDDMPMLERIRNYPTTYLIDPDGMVVAKQTGAVTSEAIENFIAQQRQK